MNISGEISYSLSKFECIYLATTVLLACVLVCFYIYHIFQIKYIRLQQHPMYTKKDFEYIHLEYIQEYMQSVYNLSLHLESAINPSKVIEKYKKLSLEVYQYIPQKNWILIKRIDKAVSRKDCKTIYDTLILFSQSLASDGIEIHLNDVTSHKSVEESIITETGE